MATVDMNSNPLDILHCQSPLFPGSRPAPSYGDVSAVGTISSRIQEPLPYKVGDVAVPHDYFKSALSAPDNNHSFYRDDEVDDNLRTTKPLDYSLHEEDSTGYQSSQQNRQYSHDFTPDASDGLTGPIQSRLGGGLGSKESPVLEKDKRDNNEGAQDTEAAYGKFDDEDINWGGFGPPTRPRIAAPPWFEKWYDVKEGRYIFEEVLEKEEAMPRSEERGGEWGDQNEEAEGVGIVAAAEERGNSQKLDEDTSPRRVKQQSLPPRFDPSPKPAQKERDGSLNSCDDNHNNTDSAQDDGGQHYTPKDPNILPSYSKGPMLMGYLEQQKSSSKRHDVNAPLTDSMPAWMALKVAARCEESATAEQDLGNAGFFITTSQITADVLCKMAYPISREIERRLQELPNSLRHQRFSGDEEGLRTSLWHCHNTFDDSCLPAKPPKKRGRPALEAQSPKAKKRKTQPPPEAKKRGRPRKARALEG